MQNRLSLVLALAVLPSLAACSLFLGPVHKGSGVSATEQRTMRPFAAIDSVGSIDLVIRVGEPIRVVVSGDDNLIEHVITEVDGDRLSVHLENGSYELESPLLVTVSMPTLNAVELNGSGDAEISGLSGGSLSLSLLGSGDVKASGEVDRLEASITGSGDMRLRDLRTHSVEASILGSGDMTVQAEENLTGSVQGSGDIDYWGSPREIDVESLGSGSVTGH